MSDVQALAIRPDEDILNDVQTMIYHYPPLNQDRHHVQAAVVNGRASLSGYVKTWNTRRYLEGAMPQIRGVTDVDLSRLFDDDSIRLEVGKVIPVGVLANVEYGTVVLTGHAPEGMTADELAAKVGAVQGVRRVVTAFRNG